MPDVFEEEEAEQQVLFADDRHRRGRGPGATRGLRLRRREGDPRRSAVGDAPAAEQAGERKHILCEQQAPERGCFGGALRAQQPQTRLQRDDGGKQKSARRQRLQLEAARFLLSARRGHGPGRAAEPAREPRRHPQARVPHRPAPGRLRPLQTEAGIRSGRHRKRARGKLQ